MAATERFALMDWLDAEWDVARQAAEQFELALLKRSCLTTLDSTPRRPCLAPVI